MHGKLMRTQFQINKSTYNYYAVSHYYRLFSIELAIASHYFSTITFLLEPYYISSSSRQEQAPGTDFKSFKVPDKGLLRWYDQTGLFKDMFIWKECEGKGLKGTA